MSARDELNTALARRQRIKETLEICKQKVRDCRKAVREEKRGSTFLADRRAAAFQRYLELLKMHVVNNWTFKRIAQETGVSPGRISELFISNRDYKIRHPDNKKALYEYVESWDPEHRKRALRICGLEEDEKV